MSFFKDAQRTYEVLLTKFGRSTFR